MSIERTAEELLACVQTDDTTRRCILVDDWNMVELIYGPQLANRLFRKLRAFTLDSNSNTFISVQHADVSDNPVTLDLATLVIDTKGFDSGHITNVHGQVHISYKCKLKIFNSFLFS